MAFNVPNEYRIRSGGMRTSDSIGNNGAFFITVGKVTLRVIGSDGFDWEHVSVSLHDRCPTWDEMCAVKSLFWGKDDCVVQFHPPERDYVNCHKFCLHLFKSKKHEFVMPDRFLVGPKGD